MKKVIAVIVGTHVAAVALSAAATVAMTHSYFPDLNLRTLAALNRCGSALDHTLADRDALRNLIYPPVTQKSLDGVNVEALLDRPYEEIPSAIEHVPVDERYAETHNTLGGYIPACGNKPGLLGDDC